MDSEINFSVIFFINQALIAKNSLEILYLNNRRGPLNKSERIYFFKISNVIVVTIFYNHFCNIFIKNKRMKFSL